MPTCEKTVIHLYLKHHASDLPRRWTHRGIHTGGGRSEQRPRVKERKKPFLFLLFVITSASLMTIRCTEWSYCCPWLHHVYRREKEIKPGQEGKTLQPSSSECSLSHTMHFFVCVHVLLTCSLFCSLFVLEVPKQCWCVHSFQITTSNVLSSHSAEWYKHSVTWTWIYSINPVPHIVFNYAKHLIQYIHLECYYVSAILKHIFRYLRGLLKVIT